MSERMNPQVKAQWLTALRSGEYEQAKGALHRLTASSDEDGEERVAGWCCYGVLCDVAAKNGVQVIRKSDSDREFEYFDGDMSWLPTKVYDWAGLDDRDPVVDGKSLAYRNDFRGMSLAEIADLIEEHL
jgi:hypothetical protein